MFVFSVWWLSYTPNVPSQNSRPLLNPSTCQVLPTLWLIATWSRHLGMLNQEIHEIHLSSVPAFLARTLQYHHLDATYPSNSIFVAPAPVDSGSIHHSWSPMWLPRAPRRCYPLDRYLCANEVITRFHWRWPFLLVILSSSLFRVYATPISGLRSPQKGKWSHSDAAFTASRRKSYVTTVRGTFWNFAKNGRETSMLHKCRSEATSCRRKSRRHLTTTTLHDNPYIMHIFNLWYNLLKLDQNDPMSEVIQSQHHKCASSKLSITMHQSSSSSFPSIFVDFPSILAISPLYFPAYLAFNLQTSIRTNHQTQLGGLFQGAIRQQSTRCIAWWQVVSRWSLQIHVVYSFWVFIIDVVIIYIFLSSFHVCF